MASPPRPDKLPGPIRYKKPSGKPGDRPLEQIHQIYEDHQRSRKGDRPLVGARKKSRTTASKIARKKARKKS